MLQVQQIEGALKDQSPLEAIELPFLWTFVGTFGGLEAFGIVGLFIGPAVMAALFLVWREWLGADYAHPRRRKRRRAPS